MPKYVYIQTEPRLWTVGFYTPSGKWVPESDWPSPEEAAQRVHYLNGGSNCFHIKVCPYCGEEHPVCQHHQCAPDTHLEAAYEERFEME